MQRSYHADVEFLDRDALTALTALTALAERCYLRSAVGVADGPLDRHATVASGSATARWPRRPISPS
ncbi:MAG: hypothetical protein HYU51_07700 [Candidatus Rokubacteria bacterium]|nr:hypothetical protein [Candidatus Rokubacteria bacterium]